MKLLVQEKTRSGDIPKMKTTASLFLISSLLIATACDREEPTAPARPHVTVSGSVQNKTVTIQITVPTDHHAYLDRGSEGNLVPISFDWSSLSLDKTAEPALRSAPKGVFDKTVKATVLRGSGTFQFETAAESIAGKTIRVQSQICDDIQGICFRPEFNEVTLIGNN